MGRAADGSRTRDLHHGKVALYQLSYCRMRASFEEHAGKHYPIPGVPHAGPAVGSRGTCHRYPALTCGSTGALMDRFSLSCRNFRSSHCWPRTVWSWASSVPPVLEPAPRIGELAW